MQIALNPTGKGIVCDWTSNIAAEESTLHQLSPYIGKIKSSMAASLVRQFSDIGDLVYDPFSGSGTIALEAWRLGRRTLASDLSPYAYVLTHAKLFPYASFETALARVHELTSEVEKQQLRVDLRRVPKWVRSFFHPRTLKEALGWCTVLQRHGENFLLASLLGILHHQRPGFLSFPSSHTVPYLRGNKFPKSQFGDLYDYRPLLPRFEAKLKRAFRRVPRLDFNIERSAMRRSALAPLVVTANQVDSIITSPPYMRLLEYGRDNRLRLWFLGLSDWKELDEAISPKGQPFLQMMRSCFTGWRTQLKPSGLCVLVVGDAFNREQQLRLPDLLAKIAVQEVKGYIVVDTYTEQIPRVRRVRRNDAGSSTETVLVLRATKET